MRPTCARRDSSASNSKRPVSASYDLLQERLRAKPHRWLVTGAAGFIGSHLVEKLLQLQQSVVGMDNLSTGRWKNLAEVAEAVTAEEWGRFRYIEADITSLDACRAACAGVQIVLHQAALGSVPRSLHDPLRTHGSNVCGFVNMLEAARHAAVQRFVYASSSSVYGDNPMLPKSEPNVGQPLSPYAGTKIIDEIYAGIFHRCYQLPVVGLRYFNVFGPRQDPNGEYAAVIPRWFTATAKGLPVFIYGDGKTSRDFCYIANVVQANLLAATTGNLQALGQVYNVAVGYRTSLNELFAKIRLRVEKYSPGAANVHPEYHAERAGDVRHSLADISRIRADLGYVPAVDLEKGLDETAAWSMRSLPATN